MAVISLLVLLLLITSTLGDGCSGDLCFKSERTDMWMNPGVSITSNNGEIKLEMRTDGNLALTCTDTGKIIWQSDTAGDTINSNKGLKIQDDGNMVVYNNANQPLWSSGSNDFFNSRKRLELVAQNDRNLVLYKGLFSNNRNDAIWSTGTANADCKIQCSALHSSWMNVRTNPVLPVYVGTQVNFICSGVGSVNEGGDRATCSDSGELVLESGQQPPNCITKENCGTKDSWEGVMSDPPFPVSHSLSMTLFCKTGYTNNGQNQPTASCNDGSIVDLTAEPSCSKFDIVWNNQPPSSGNRRWVPILDFLTTPILLKTDKTIGSGEDLRINFMDGEGNEAGSFVLLFSDPPKYGFLMCTDLMKANKNLPVDLPHEDLDNVRVFKIESHGLHGLKISCNDVELLTFEPSSSTCSWGSWQQTWSNDKTKINFSFDDAVNKYALLRAPGKHDNCNSLYYSTWENVETDINLPASHDAEIRFSCPDNFVNRGGSTATCHDGIIVPNDTPPMCLASSDCYSVNDNLKNVVISEPQMPIENGDDITLGCKVGYYNKGGSEASCENGQIVVTGDNPNCHSHNIDWKEKSSTTVLVDLKATPFLVKTNAEEGSLDLLQINFHDALDADAGGFSLVFSQPPIYGFQKCTSLNQATRDLQKPLPAADGDGFRYFKIETKNTNGLKISCNDEELLNFEPSENECTGWSQFSDDWSKPKRKITFDFDESINEYAILTDPSKCYTPDTQWNKVTINPELPVEDDQTVTFSCPAEHTNKGSSDATCRGGELQFADAPPNCRADCTTQDESLEENLTEISLPVPDGTQIDLNCAQETLANKGGTIATCQDGNLVTEKPPLCVEKDACVLDTLKDGVTKDTEENVMQNGDEVEFSCESEDYIIEGASKASCEDGQIVFSDGEPPSCKKFWYTKPSSLFDEIDIDFRKSSILLKTEGSSEDSLEIRFEDSDGTESGGFLLDISQNKYGMIKCTSLNTATKDLPTVLPDADENGKRIFRIDSWRINGLNITCNGQELLTFEPTEQSCQGWGFWDDTWYLRKEQIQFTSNARAIERYAIIEGEERQDDEPCFLANVEAFGTEISNNDSKSEQDCEEMCSSYIHCGAVTRTSSSKCVLLGMDYKRKYSSDTSAAERSCFEPERKQQGFSLIGKNGMLLDFATHGTDGGILAYNGGPVCRTGGPAELLTYAICRNVGYKTGKEFSETLTDPNDLANTISSLDDGSFGGWSEARFNAEQFGFTLGMDCDGPYLRECVNATAGDIEDRFDCGQSRLILLQCSDGAYGSPSVAALLLTAIFIRLI